MSEACKDQCQWAIPVVAVAGEDPQAYMSQRRTMTKPEGLHTPAQIARAKCILPFVENCGAAVPGCVRDCSALAGATLVLALES